MRFLIFVLFILATLLNPLTVQAHVLKSSGNIGAVMHITPEDDPIAGEQSDFFFEFKDKEGKFKPENCDCIATILNSGNEIYKQPLFSNNSDPSLSSASFSFTFPQTGIYTVQISGRPKAENEFNSFNLIYDLRVERISDEIAATSSNIPTPSEENNWLWDHIVHLGGGLVIVGFLIFALLAKNKRKAAVIILALALIAHSVPIKAIHASHESGLIHESYSCCLPVSVVLPEEPITNLSEEFVVDFLIFSQTEIRFDSALQLFIRPPPLS